MTNYEDLSKNVFAALKGSQLDIQMFDKNGFDTINPKQARRFFVLNPNIMITVNEETEDSDGSVVFNKGASADSPSIESMQRRIQNIVKKEPTVNFKIETFGKDIEPKDFADEAKLSKDAIMENDLRPRNHLLISQIKNMVRVFGGSISEADLTSNLGIMDLSEIAPTLKDLVDKGELVLKRDKHGHPLYSNPKLDMMPSAGLQESFSRWFGSRKVSRQVIENVRILVKHSRPVSEEVKGSRTRQIAEIFLECNGERFRFKENYLPGARAMARHLSFGGSMTDKVGTYITESTTQLLKLSSFNRYVLNNRLINESSSGIVEIVKENIETLRLELRKLAGSKTYESVKARLETFEKQPLAEDDVSQLKDLFTIRRFDEKFEEVLPIVKQLIQEKDTYHKRIEEAAGQPILLKRGTIDSAPVFEFASNHARLGYKLNELALRIVENQELSEFITKIGSRVSKEGKINAFERAVLNQVFENATFEKAKSASAPIKESQEIEYFFNKYERVFL